MRGRRACPAVLFEEMGDDMETNLRDMTVGRPRELILRFALPLMLGSMFQQFYAMVDAAVLGRGVGVDALAAVGATDWLNWMIISSCLGLTQGFSILMAQHFGSEDFPALRRTIAQSTLLTLASALLFTIASLALVRPILGLLKTPAEIMEGAVLYITIIFLGIPIIMAYNLLSALLRALGDGKTPLIAMVIAAAINIVLDLLFVMVFHWGIAGAGIATLMAQCFSGLYCFLSIRRVARLRPERADWRPDGPLCARLLKLGLPIAAQNGIISVGGLAVQSVANGFGVVFVAGYTTTNKLYGLLELAATSFGYSMCTFMGQNIGARKYHRMRQGLRSGVLMALGVSVCITVVILLFGRQIASLFVSASDQDAAQVVAIAFEYLSIMATFLSILYLLNIYRSALQGMGDTIMPMVSGIAELAMRIGAAFLLPVYIGHTGVFAAEICAWTLASLLLMATYYVRMHRLPRLDEPPAPESTQPT